MLYPNPHLSDIERTRVVELKARVTATKLLLNSLKMTTSSLINLLSIAYGIVGNPKEHSMRRSRGCHSLYPEHEKKLFVLHILKNRSITPKDLAHDPVVNTRQASARTIQRYVNNMGLQSNIAP